MVVDKRKLRTVIIQQCCLVILISSLVSSVNFGLISPIVEEWGCQDSEIRLTCSNLDSTIAIIEATFKPNCSLISPNSSNSSENATDGNNCVQIDLKRLTPVNLSPRMNPRREETVAGRRFLEALRQNQKAENESVGPTVQSVKTASFNFGMSPKKDDDNELKRKRMTLRTSLEELLVEYLQSLAPGGDDPVGHQSRVKRSENTVQNNDFAEYDDEQQPENSDAENVNNWNVREENGIRNNYSVENANEHIEFEDRGNRTSNTTRSVCSERRQRITQLDRNELNAAIQNVSEHEHNIRRLLNYRCSGKNHCSFVFNEDHPFSVLWPIGTVHIKYICMERYRLNKICGEHLIVVNESPEPDPPFPPHQRSVPNADSSNYIDINDANNSVERDGPVAEALIQNEQMFHSLKILKPSPSETENERRKSASMQQLDKPTPRKGVYSQDFRVMKILPANLDDFNDIEKIADEFYFKNEEDVEIDDVVDIDNVQHNVNYPSSIATKPALTSTQPTTVHAVDQAKKPIEHVEGTKNVIDDAFDSSNNGLRDVRSTLGYDELNNHKYLSSVQPIQTISAIDDDMAVTHTQQTTVNLWNNELLPPNTNIFETMPVDSSLDVFDTNENQTNGQSNAKIVRTENDFTVIKTNRADMDREWESGEEYEDSDEDYAIRVEGPRVWRKNRIRTHTSFQKTAIRQPLLQQGFIASPGYPKYYVGNSNCSWRISVPSGQRIRLILFDTNLRYDKICKDYLHIIDVGSKTVLYKNCSETVVPFQILSESNELQIALRTTSALAYPKRRVLIYYSALGCIVPTAPHNGQLVSQTDDSVKFICDPSYVFADTLLGSRTLYCTDRNIWDNSLPNCIEHSTTKTKKDPYITSLWKQNRLGSKSNSNQADAIYDILIPLLLMIGLFVINGFIVLIIWRYRQKRKNQQEEDGLARL